MKISEIFPPDGHLQTNYCDLCKTNLDLIFSEFDETLSGVHVRISGLPYLKCLDCQAAYLPDDSRFAIIEQHRMAIERGASVVRVKRNKIERDFGFTSIPFKYDPDEYFYTPGLYRQFDPGFLTPVYFKRSVLLKYDKSPDYRVNFASTTYGQIETDADYISFGINRHGHVVMWLGDIAKLPEDEQYYLRSENIDSDLSIGSEFYDGQIECKFTARPRESELFRVRSEFIEAFFNRFAKKVAHLDDEVMTLTLGLIAPVIDTEKERGHLADALNKIYIESFDNGALEGVLQGLGGEPAKLGTLKRLQGILDRVAGSETSSVISPLFALYDFRVAHSHLTSKASADAKMKTVFDRLGIPEGAGLDVIYPIMMDKLTSCFSEMAEILGS